VAIGTLSGRQVAQFSKLPVETMGVRGGKIGVAVAATIGQCEPKSRRLGMRQIMPLVAIDAARLTPRPYCTAALLRFCPTALLLSCSTALLLFCSAAPLLSCPTALLLPCSAAKCSMDTLSDSFINKLVAGGAGRADLGSMQCGPRIRCRVNTVAAMAVGTRSRNDQSGVLETMSMYAGQVFSGRLLMAIATDLDLRPQTGRRPRPLAQGRSEGRLCRRTSGRHGDFVRRVCLRHVEACGVASVAIMTVNSVLPVNILGKLIRGHKQPECVSFPQR
jgi:hypothetical protein